MQTRAGLFAAFAGLGVTASFIPAILPTAERAMSADLSVAVPALFAGLLVGVLASGPLLGRRPARDVLVAGSVLQAVAIAAAAWSGAPALFVAAAAVAGFGFGLVEASGSVAAKAATAHSATGLLSALMGTVAVSAAVTPLVIAVGSAVPPALAAVAVVPAAAAALLVRTDAAAPSARTRRPPLRDLLPLAPFALALPLYVGVETVLSGWSAVIPERALALDPAAAALGTSAFWALMALGRFTTAGLRRHGVRPLTILTTAAVSAAVLLATAGLLIGSAPVWALVAIAISIVALAPSYGLILGLALDRLDPSQSETLTGALVACGAVGGTFVPAGILLFTRDPAAAGTFVVAAALCALVPVLVLLARRAAA